MSGRGRAALALELDIGLYFRYIAYQASFPIIHQQDFFLSCGPVSVRAVCIINARYNKRTSVRLIL
jgi:hypothetical protein